MVKATLFVFLLLVVLNLVVYLYQPHLVFYPYKLMNQNPVAWGMEYEDVYFYAQDGIKLNGWFIPNPDAKNTLLFFHGNAGNISHRGESIKIFNRLGLNVFIIDYRGYGRSQGTVSESGLYLDAAAAWRYLTQTRGLTENNIVIFGRSLGGAVAANLARDVQPGALILESTFGSARDMAKQMFPLVSPLFISRYDFNTERYIQSIHSPLLVLHSIDDEIIPFRLGQRLFSVAKEPKYFKQLSGDHNSGFLFSQPDYEKTLAQFLFESNQAKH